MNWRLCMQTPAGEKFTSEIGIVDQDAKFAAVPAVRILMSDAIRWVDGHIGRDFKVNPPLAGPDYWHFNVHKEDQTCPLCTTS